VRTSAIMSEAGRDDSGSALLTVIVLLAVMCVFMLCAAQSIGFVKRELKLVEKKQAQRWERTTASSSDRK
jgi:hypothetical protein